MQFLVIPIIFFTSHTMAALTLVTLPVVVLYMFFQRQIVEGVARSGIK